MKYLFSIALFPALLLAKGGDAGYGDPAYGLCHASPFNVRYPPVIQANDSWQAPPYSWTFGHWYITYSSFPPYLQLYNFESDLYPRFPTTEVAANLRQTLDLATYNAPPTGNTTADNHVYTVFGLDTPAPEIGVSTFNFSGQGYWNLTNYYSIIAWGYDTEGYEYYVQYETPPAVDVEGDIAIVSRKNGGPSPVTLKGLFNALNTTFAGEKRGNLESYAGNQQKIPTDGRRGDGTAIVACDEACVENAWMVGL